MKITMHGNPLTLVGTPIKTGETAPVFYGINQQMQPVSLKEFAGKVYKITRDDAGQRLTHMKLTGGELKLRISIRWPPS